MRGRFISVEGLDGTGKTTICAALRDRLTAQGVVVACYREPGGTPLGEQIRSLLADPSRAISARAELLLFQAARAELVHTVVRPALNAGTWVILDRFTDSTLAYQGAGRGLGDDVVRAATDLSTAGLTPDRTLLLQAPAQIRALRLADRGALTDRVEGAGAELFARTQARYDALLTQEGGRVRAVDASGDIETVLGRAWDAIADLLPTVASG